MVKRILLLLILFPSFVLAQKDAPLRADSDFDLQIEVDVRKKPIPPSSEKNYKRDYQLHDASLLPFLSIILEIKNRKEDEIRILVEDGDYRSVYISKISDKPIKLDLGYTDDMKDGLTASKFYIYIMAKKQKVRNMITIEVQKDGNFLINGALSGRF